MTLKFHDKLTRKVFHNIHQDINENKKTYKRLSSLFNFKNLNLKESYFKDKICADFGCGTTGVGALNLLKMGAKYIHLVDMHKQIKKPINQKLRKFRKKYEINISSIEKTSFNKNYFDFILCQGVIHHAKNDNNCFKEIYRVLKPGGIFLMQVNGESGLLTKFTMEILRPEYRKNPIVKKVIDNIMNGNLNDYKKFYFKNSNKKSIKLLSYLLKYIDNDAILSFKDRLLAPKYKTYNEKKLKVQLSKIGFKKIKRLRKKIKYTNIRRLLEPFYYHYDHELSRTIYGEGSLTFIMKKTI